ncbi:MAG TPA: hypothetical protein VLG28_00075 [Acidimicrobiia bacterium]|nr:hypothetical protein [Acidimicrobiia bacterium]
MIEIPPVVRQKAIAPGAQRWLPGLPALLKTLLDDWNLALDGWLGGGTESGWPRWFAMTARRR